MSLLDFFKQKSSVADENGITPLHVADSGAAVDALIRAGANPNAKDIDGDTPLHWAKTGELVEALVRGGANPNMANDSDESPLHIAKSGDVVDALVRAGANPNASDASEWRFATPLHLTRSGEVVEALVRAGANPNARDHDGGTPLHYAARGMGDGTTVEALVSVGADPYAVNDSDTTPLDVAKLHGTLQAFQDAGVDLNANSLPRYTELRDAQGADVDALDNEGLRFEDGNSDSFVDAVQTGMNAYDQAREDSTFDAASEREQEESWVDQLAQAEIADDPDETEAKLDALDQAGRVELANMGERRDAQGRTALHDAVSSVRFEGSEDKADLALTDALLKAGFDPNARDNEGRTPLHVSHDPDAATLLIGAGADIEAKDNFGHRVTEGKAAAFTQTIEDALNALIPENHPSWAGTMDAKISREYEEERRDAAGWNDNNYEPEQDYEPEHEEPQVTKQFAEPIENHPSWAGTMDAKISREYEEERRDAAGWNDNNYEPEQDYEPEHEEPKVAQTEQEGPKSAPSEAVTATPEPKAPSLDELYAALDNPEPTAPRVDKPRTKR